MHSLLAARGMHATAAQQASAPQPSACSIDIGAVHIHFRCMPQHSRCQGHHPARCARSITNIPRVCIDRSSVAPAVTLHLASDVGTARGVQCSSASRGTGRLAGHEAQSSDERLVAECAARVGLLEFLFAIFAAGAAPVWLAAPRALGCMVACLTGIFLLSTIRISAIITELICSYILRGSTTTTGTCPCNSWTMLHNGRATLGACNPCLLHVAANPQVA